jgi:hypothetical protein
MFRYVIATFVLAGLSVQAQDAAYGVDCSFPIHSKEFRCGDVLGDRKKVYDEFMEGCRAAYGKKGKRCDSTENDRLEMSLRQPQSMVVRASSIARLLFCLIFFDFLDLQLASMLITAELHEDWLYENSRPERSSGFTHCSLGTQQG